jgi:hypothetical protein
VAVASFAALALWSTANAQTPLGISGYLDFAYQGWVGHDSPDNPTGEKPQSKLWWHDGFWWGSLYSTAAGEFRIHRLNWGTQTWEDTGVPIDDRETSKADAVSFGKTLYILSHHVVLADGKTTSNAAKFARLYRYTYDSNTQLYSLDAGFPATVNEDEAEHMVLARDSAGHLWVSWVSRAETADIEDGGTGRVYQVYVTYSSNGGTSWSAPFVPNVGDPTATIVDRGDVATIVAFSNQVGIMWNSGIDNSLHFANRTGGANNPADPWTREDIIVPSVPEGADDHISMQSLQVTGSGVVVGAIKTNAQTSDPIPVIQSLIGIVVRDPATGDFVFREYSRNSDKDTRPIVVIDQADRAVTTDDKVYVFVTGKEGGSKICYKSLAITSPVTAMGNFEQKDCGTSLIEDNIYKFINDATAQRNNVDKYTGIVVLASGTTTTTATFGNYVHGVLGNPPPVVTARLPISAQLNVPVDTSITVTFSKRMDGATLNPTNFSVWEGVTAVPGAVTFDANRTALFIPTAPLEANTVYTVKLTNNIKDTSGLRLNEFENLPAGTVVEQWPFTTAGGTVQFALASYLALESSGTATVTVNLSTASGQQVTVDYATSNGSAAAGSDYTATSGTLNFAPGETSKSFFVPILDDGGTEGDETVNLTLSNPAGATLGVPNPAILTIVDDEGPVSVNFTPATYTVDEAIGSATITATLSRPEAVNTITVNYATSNGTATAPGDYTATSGTLTFSPNQTVKTFTVPIINDPGNEPDETVNLTLSSPSNAVLGSAPSATLTIVDNDTTPSVLFSAATYSAGEAAGTTNLTVNLSAASATPVTVNYATVDGGSATEGADYTAASGTLTFNPGETSKSLPVAILQDTLDELDETVNVALSAPTNATLGTPFGATLTITDDDAPPTVQFKVAADTKGEPAGEVQIEVVLSTASGQQVDVNYAVTGGTATPDLDFGAVSGILSFGPGQLSAIIDLTLIDDVTDEPDETVILTLSSPANATLGPVPSFTLTIDDNDAPDGPPTYRNFGPVIIKP